MLKKALLGALCAGLSACGTTVPLTSSTATAGGGLPADGSAMSGQGGQVAPPSGSGANGETATGGASAGRNTPSLVGGSTPSDGHLPTSTAVGSGRPAPTAGAPVVIGYGNDDISDFLQSAGFSIGSTGDMPSEMKVIADDINAHGGLAGHPIKLLQYKFRSAQALSNPSAAAAEACSAWAQDGKASAVVMPDLLNESLLACLGKAGVPAVNAGGLANLQTERFYQRTYTAYPLLFNVGTVVGETYDRIVVQRLVARDFFHRWNTQAGAPGAAPMKLGVIEPTTPDGDAALKSLQQQLALHGITPAAVYRSSPDTSQAVSESSNIVLRFRSAGVTHVMGALGAPFMENAESQGYRPRYLIAGIPSVYASTVPAAQLSGAMAEDNLPAIDTDAAHDPGDPSAATAHCKKIMKAAGQDYADRTTLASMLVRCDSLYFLKAAADAGGGVTSREISAGFASLGTRAKAAATWGSDFTAQRRASGATLRDLVYSRTCTCFTFISPRDWS